MNNVLRGETVWVLVGKRAWPFVLDGETIVRRETGQGITHICTDI